MAAGTEMLHEMAIFARVVEARSFTGAARALGLSKSAVSKQVARLEDALGARLLNRTTRQLSLTEAGQGLYERCARMLEEAEAAVEEVGMLTGAPRGRLTVNVPMTFGIMHLGPAIGGFLARYPDIQLELRLDDRFVDLVADGVDVALRISEQLDETLVARTVAPVRRLLCAAPAYLARHGTPQRPEDLMRHNCFRYTLGPSGDNWRLTGADGPVDVPVRGSLLANNAEVLRDAAAAGQGILRAPHFIVAGALADGSLVEILPGADEGEQLIRAVYLHRRHVPPKVRVFVDFLVERFGGPDAWCGSGKHRGEP